MRAYWEKVAWLYFDDLGEAYWTSAQYGTVKQKDDDGRPLIGGRAPTDRSELYKVKVLARYPLKVRTVTVVNLENGRRRQVVIYSLDAPLWVGTATAIQMREQEPIAGSQYVTLVQGTFQVRAGKDEIFRGHRRRDTTAPPVPTPRAGDDFDSTIEAGFWEMWGHTTKKIRLVRQHPVLGYRLDFAHLPSRTAIELDGYYYLADPDRFRKDRRRDRELAAQGWRVVRFAGEEVLEDVARCVAEAFRLIRAHPA